MQTIKKNDKITKNQLEIFQLEELEKRYEMGWIKPKDPCDGMAPCIPPMF